MIIQRPIQALRSFSTSMLSIAALTSIALLYGGGTTRSALATEVFEARVSKVIDGDTFSLRGQSRRIRIWGLDAPEREEAGGTLATGRLRQLIDGQRLRCSLVDIDRYGRLVAQCYLPDGRDIAAEMIRFGVAREYCRYSRGYYGRC